MALKRLIPLKTGMGNREPEDLPAVLLRKNLTAPAEVRLYAVSIMCGLREAGMILEAGRADLLFCLFRFLLSDKQRDTGGSVDGTLGAVKKR